MEHRRPREGSPMSDPRPVPTESTSVSRRRFIEIGGAGVAAGSLLTMLDARQAPAQIKGTNLRMLLWSHYVPAYDVWFDKFTKEWGDKTGVKVRVDHMPHLELPARYAAEFAAGSGHDLIYFVGQILTGAVLSQPRGPLGHRRQASARSTAAGSTPRRAPRRSTALWYAHPRLLHLDPRPVAQGPLRLGRDERARRPGTTSGRPRGAAQGQGPSDGHAVLALQRRQPQLARPDVLLRRQGD